MENGRKYWVRTKIKSIRHEKRLITNKIMTGFQYP